MEAGAAQAVVGGAHQADADSSEEAREAVGAVDQEEAALVDVGAAVVAQVEGGAVSAVVEVSVGEAASGAHSRCCRCVLLVCYMYIIFFARSLH